MEKIKPKEIWGKIQEIESADNTLYQYHRDLEAAASYAGEDEVISSNIFVK